MLAQLKVLVPPPMNTMEQLLAVQNAISQVEELVQDGNIVLLKLRALLLAGSSQVFPHPKTHMACMPCMKWICVDGGACMYMCVSAQTGYMIHRPKQQLNNYIPYKFSICLGAFNCCNDD